jgi:hypothetical protein
MQTIMTSGASPANLRQKHDQNLPNVFDAALLFATRSTLNRTVFDSGRHWPSGLITGISDRRVIFRYGEVGRTNGNDVPNLSTERRRDMYRRVPMPLLVSV